MVVHKYYLKIGWMTQFWTWKDVTIIEVPHLYLTAVATSQALFVPNAVSEGIAAITWTNICCIWSAFVGIGAELTVWHIGSEEEEDAERKTDNRGVWVPWAFKLDHLHPNQPILFCQFSICFTFILGASSNYPRGANSEKRELFQLQNWMRQWSLSARGI